MENTNEYLHQVSAIFIFCFALAILIFSNKELNNTIKTTRISLQNANVLYEQATDVKFDSTITYSQMIATLMHELEYDIEVNGVLLKAKEYNPLRFDFNSILMCEYHKTYEYDEYGDIKKIIYQS